MRIEIFKDNGDLFTVTDTHQARTSLEADYPILAKNNELTDHDILNWILRAVESDITTLQKLEKRERIET